MANPLDRVKAALQSIGLRRRTESDVLQALETALADRYAIEREIGAGGMARVFLARDLKHDRRVAVKVLRPELVARLGAERFLQEIRVTARLQHPHILPLYDSGRAHEYLFYVMPHIEGETLRAKLNRERELSIDEAVKIAEQVAEALGSAHREGVVHRDIKPENILLREGHAVVADFGIALALEAAGGTRLTETGLSLGTPAYMSPEQASGDRQIDGRSDIYALGCVLYEMLAGEPPFVASSARAVLLKHMTDPVPPVTTLRPNVPTPLATAIARALSKSPADRFDTAGEFSQAVSAESTGVQGIHEAASLVVLPFENLSPDPENAFFADGLTEELIAELSGLQQLRVISRTSAMQFKDSDKSVPDIARALQVRYVLEGSVRRQAASVKITAQLIDGATDTHLWADRYTGALGDIFDLQERLARRIAEALRVALTPEDARRLESRRFDDFRAYDALLRARHEMMRLSAEGMARATHFIQQAQDIAGDNALVQATLARCCGLAYEFGISHERETLEEAERHASKALELAPDLGLALFAKAHARSRHGDLEEALRLLRRARETDRNADALNLLAGILAQIGRMDEAREVAAEALLLDPLDIYTRGIRGWVEFLDGKFGLAAARFREAVDAAVPRLPHIEWTLALALAHAGQRDEARSIAARVAETDAAPVADLSELYCRAADGDRAGVAALLSERTVMVETARTDELFPLAIADCLAMVGDEDGALEWLGAAVDRGFFNYRYLREHDRFLDSLHGDSRFERLMDDARRKAETFGGKTPGR